MTIFKVTVKSTFYVEAEHLPAAKKIADKAIDGLPHAECNIKATKMSLADFQDDGGLD